MYCMELCPYHDELKDLYFLIICTIFVPLHYYNSLNLFVFERADLPLQFICIQSTMSVRALPIEVVCIIVKKKNVQLDTY